MQRRSMVAVGCLLGGVLLAGMPARAQAQCDFTRDYTTLFVKQGDTDPPRSTTLNLVCPGHSYTDPTASGVPAWLEVSAEIRGDTIAFTNAINMDALPADTGIYKDTITVGVTGTADTWEYTVTLRYTAPPPPPIVILSPKEGDTVYVGDTLDVVFNADCDEVPLVWVGISVDGGETPPGPFTTDGGGQGCEGDSQVVSYVVPDSLDLDLDGTMTSLVSDNCVLLVGEYPSGNEAYVGPFVIAARSNGVAQRRSVAAVAVPNARRVGLSMTSSGAVVRVTAGARGSQALFDIRGRRMELSAQQRLGARPGPR